MISTDIEQQEKQNRHFFVLCEFSRRLDKGTFEQARQCWLDVVGFFSYLRKCVTGVLSNLGRVFQSATGKHWKLLLTL